PTAPAPGRSSPSRGRQGWPFSISTSTPAYSAPASHPARDVVDSGRQAGPTSERRTGRGEDFNLPSAAPATYSPADGWTTIEAAGWTAPSLPRLSLTCFGVPPLEGSKWVYVGILGVVHSLPWFR